MRVANCVAFLVRRISLCLAVPIYIYFCALLSLCLIVLSRGRHLQLRHELKDERRSR